MKAKYLLLVVPIDTVAPVPRVWTAKQLKLLFVIMLGVLVLALAAIVATAPGPASREPGVAASGAYRAWRLAVPQEPIAGGKGGITGDSQRGGTAT